MLNKEKQRILQKQEFQFLKSLRLPAGFFEGYVDEAMTFIEEAYGNRYREKQKLKDPYIFNAISKWDFLNWVHDNYNISFESEIRYIFVK